MQQSSTKPLAQGAKKVQFTKDTPRDQTNNQDEDTFIIPIDYDPRLQVKQNQTTYYSKWIMDPKRNKSLQRPDDAADLEKVSIDIIALEEDCILGFIGYMADQAGYLEFYYKKIVDAYMIEFELKKEEYQAKLRKMKASG